MAGRLLTLDVTEEERSGSALSCSEEERTGAEGASQEDCDAGVKTDLRLK
jgi:hypothetical protein